MDAIENLKTWCFFEKCSLERKVIKTFFVCVYLIYEFAQVKSHCAECMQCGRNSVSTVLSELQAKKIREAHNGMNFTIILGYFGTGKVLYY